ncbi:gustatory receptor for sugar taste 64c-like [Wyeomyia smithii]|uniref:gustatory receptor for sugar taste 64c-like n=1 Tax=Wyeomyia smithii TaxID=174621 RepID=UPI002467FE2D|nr:gustatory receptor for sugar taste 64c-like [Wyeomyia smithii]
MPVVGIFSCNPRAVRFKLLSLRFLYAMLYIVVGGFYVVIACRRCILKGLNVSYFGDVVYMVVVYSTAILFFFAAFSWHEVLKEFSNCEALLLNESYRRVTLLSMRWNLAWKMRTMVFGLLVLAIIEDSLHYYAAYEENIVQMQFCNRTNISFWTNFYMREHPQVFQQLPVNVGSMLLVEWINKCMRYTWTYLDMFIISFSFGVQFRYGQIYYRLISAEGGSYPLNYWRDIRKDYVAVSQLVAFLDEKFGHLILLACANDMYFIATQLFNGFQRRPAFATMVYFWYSLTLLIFRTVCMLYVGSGVHVASMSPLNILRNVPSKYWGIDLQRLTDDVAAGDNKLSGKKFFYLKRQIILAMAGTLVTYELVLMDQVKQAPDLTKDCVLF